VKEGCYGHASIADRQDICACGNGRGRYRREFRRGFGSFGFVTFLERAYEKAEGMRKIRLAQALALYGSKTGVPTLVSAIASALAGAELPKRTANILYVTAPLTTGP
jgi:hypothetical protein